MLNLKLLPESRSWTFCPSLVLVGDDFENRVREELGMQVVSTDTQLGDLGQQPASLSVSLLVNSYSEHP